VESLEVYLKDPLIEMIEIDNNLVENAIGPTALERRTGCSSETPTLQNAVR
jgi:hypothetical protein